VAAMAIEQPTPEEVAAWVERTTTAQGVAVRVSDPEAVEAVASLLRDGREPVVKDAKSA